MFSDVHGTLINQEVMMLAELLKLEGVFGCPKAKKEPTASNRYGMSLTNQLFSSEHSGFRRN